jgi:uncharacterized protein YraI
MITVGGGQSVTLTGCWKDTPAVSVTGGNGLGVAVKGAACT